MKNRTLSAALVIFILGFGAYAFGYEGGTKIIVNMTHPESGEAKFAPILVVPFDEMTPSKAVQQFLRRVPEPTLSVERIRTEKSGISSGTKAVVLFQAERKGR